MNPIDENMLRNLKAESTSYVINDFDTYNKHSKGEYYYKMNTDLETYEEIKQYINKLNSTINLPQFQTAKKVAQSSPSIGLILAEILNGK